MRAAGLLLVAAATVNGCYDGPCPPGCTPEFYIEPMETEMTVNYTADVKRVTPAPTDSCMLGAYGYPVVRQGSCRAAVAFLDGEVSVRCTEPGQCVFSIEMAVQKMRCVCPGSAEKPRINPCALGACSEGEHCRALWNGAVKCTECTEECEAMPACKDHEYVSDFPCSRQQALSRECRVVERCCRRAYCRLQRTYDACATQPCAATEQCRPTPRTCLDPEAPCEQYTCKPKQDACCEALPECSGALPEPRHACTTSEMIRGVCERREKCCRETFCGVGETNAPPQPSPCAGVQCGEKETCVVDVQKCSEPPCTQTRCTELCCPLPPVCPAGYAEAVDVCSPEDFTSGVCISRVSCCAERICRRLPGSCDAPDACPPHSQCVPDAQEARPDLSHSCEAQQTCALYSCPLDGLCFDECDAFGCSARCRARPPQCCTEEPSCAVGEFGTGSRCTPLEVEAKRCRQVAMCCNELFCRPLPPPPQEAGGASSDVTLPVWACVVVAAGICAVSVAGTVCCSRCRRVRCGAEEPSRPSTSRPSTAGTLSPRKLSVVSLDELHCVREVFGSPCRGSADNADDAPAAGVSNTEAKE